MTPETVTSFQLSVKTIALHMVDLSFSVYSSLTRVSVSSETKKLVTVTACGAVSLLFLARHFQRRKSRKKAPSPDWDQTKLQFFSPVLQDNDNTSQQNISLSLNSKNEDLHALGLLSDDCGKLSWSRQSLTSAKSLKSSNSGTCENESTCWDGPEDANICSVVNLPDTTPESLYLTGMDLFEQALSRWEEALKFRSWQAEDDACCASVRVAASGTIAEQRMEDVISVEFIRRLKSLLQRAYCLQEEFQGVLGMSAPSSHNSSEDKVSEVLVGEVPHDTCLRNSVSSNSFASIVELLEPGELRSASVLRFHPFYDEALQMAEEDRISCRVLRTEKLECLGDVDFLAKLHCVRQACQLILHEKATWTFLVKTGKTILSSIIVKAQKNPTYFEEAFEKMVSFLEHTEHWEDTEVELATIGVKHLNFYDIVLDFILMDLFDDLENPPSSTQNMINNRWLNNSFKERAVSSSCWTVLKQKRQHMKLPHGFIAHLYNVCEEISPILVWGFLGPKNMLHDVCHFFKDQVLCFLKDIFDLNKVRYSSVESLAEDMLQLLHQHCDLLLTYLEAESMSPHHSFMATQGQLVAEVQ
ncbi:mitoguardin 1 [Thalassophryne amazonica]|uniref:mitoguardin 1 n=1 Tax=Thalassophryne amazonica TaxID=390379 RepID=UPI0014712353|nr:mitoguardin 1 [Thalassophryne amazonica]